MLPNLKIFLKYRTLWLLLGLGILCTFTYGKYANALPLGVHNWAQSDRYSVAVKYLDNTNFFKVKTHNLSTVGGRTGVEFPAIQYISARFSSIISDSHLPFIYRFINLIILLAGLFYFVKQWQSKWHINALTLLGFFFSPVLFFYAFNFLPDTAGLGLLLFAFGHFIQFASKHQIKNAIFTLLFAGLATLLKTTCGIYFLALSGTLGLYYLKPLNLKTGLIVLSSFIFISLTIWMYDYYFFHKVNEDFYARVFMSKRQPLLTFSDFQGFWKGVQYWHGQYLTWPITIWVLVLMGTSLVYRKKLIKNRLGVIFLSISSVGLLLFLKIMGMQFINHDYYYITAFMPLLFMWIWLLTWQLR
ncbi:MAG: hypothetical protein ACI9JN_002864, partial [Bacteroidia bacterium]